MHIPDTWTVNQDSKYTGSYIRGIADMNNTIKFFERIQIKHFSAVKIEISLKLIFASYMQKASAASSTHSSQVQPNRDGHAQQSVTITQSHIKSPPDVDEQ